jgi:hypothetical protein
MEKVVTLFKTFTTVFYFKLKTLVVHGCHQVIIYWINV